MKRRGGQEATRSHLLGGTRNRTPTSTPNPNHTPTPTPKTSSVTARSPQVGLLMGRTCGDHRGVVSKLKKSFFCWDFSDIGGKGAAGDRGPHRGATLFHNMGDVDLSRLVLVFANRDSISLFCLVGYPDNRYVLVITNRNSVGLFGLDRYIKEVFGETSEELLKTAIKIGGWVSEAFKRAQGGGAEHVFPHITVVTGGVVNTYPTDFGREIFCFEIIDISINLDNETMLKLNRSPPLTRDDRDPQILRKKRGNLRTVLEEGKTLNEDIITPLPKREVPRGPARGDL